MFDSRWYTYFAGDLTEIKLKFQTDDDRILNKLKSIRRAQTPCFTTVVGPMCKISYDDWLTSEYHRMCESENSVYDIYKRVNLS